MDPPIYNPRLPYTGLISGGFRSGRMARISGSIPPTSQGFVINLICGHMANTSDVGLYLNPRFNENTAICNAKLNSAWGLEERQGPLTFGKGQNFEILILSEPQQYKIAVNGKHFTAFNHRVPVERITNIGIEGDVVISFIQFEGGVGGAVGHFPAAPIPQHGQSYVPLPGVPPTAGAVPYPVRPMMGTMPGSIYPPGPTPAMPVTYPPLHSGATPYPVGQPGFAPPGAVAPSAYPVAGVGVGVGIGGQPLPGQIPQQQVAAALYAHEQEKMMKKQMKKAMKDKEKQEKDAKKMNKKMYK